MPHFRLPSISHGVVSFVWGLLLGLYIWFGLVAIGVTHATSFILGAVGGFLIFLLVRVYGVEEPRRQPGRPRRRPR